MQIGKQWKTMKRDSKRFPRPLDTVAGEGFCGKICNMKKKKYIYILKKMTGNDWIKFFPQVILSWKSIAVL